MKIAITTSSFARYSDEPLKLLLGILLFALLLAYPVGHLAFVGGQPRTVLLVGLFVGPKGLELLVAVAARGFELRQLGIQPFYLVLQHRRERIQL